MTTNVEIIRDRFDGALPIYDLLEGVYAAKATQPDGVLQPVFGNRAIVSFSHEGWIPTDQDVLYAVGEVLPQLRAFVFVAYRVNGAVFEWGLFVSYRLKEGFPWFPKIDLLRSE